MAIVVSAMLMACSWPLARNMGRVLLQSTPFSIDGRLKRSISEVTTSIEICVSVLNFFFRPLLSMVFWFVKILMLAFGLYRQVCLLCILFWLNFVLYLKTSMSVVCIFG